jgi:hypothetical protein
MTDYVTHGTVQFTKRAGASPGETVQIAPTNDYAIKHSDKCYIVFIDDSLTPTPYGLLMRAFDIEHPFSCSDDHLREVLKEAAFKRIRLKLTIDDTSQIIEITIPASA